jgi:nucleotide-binding universal stress UspA family protein
MYQHILLPTDGSALSREAVTAGISLARDAGAAVLGCHVVILPSADRLDAWMHHDPHYAQRRQALFEKIADDYLAFVADRAAAQGVRCACIKAHGHEPALEIVAIAAREACDLVYIASHGWKGSGGQWPGSVTLDVLRRSPVPVLVHKAAPQAGADIGAGH